MNRLLIAGEHEDDPVVEHFREKVKSTHLVKRVSLRASGREALRGDMVLLCFVPFVRADRDITAGLSELKKNGVSTVIYARKQVLDADTAIGYCHDWDVKWVFSQYEEDDDRRSDLDERVTKILDGRCPAKRIPVNRGNLGSIGKVFAIYQFAESLAQRPIWCALNRHNLVFDDGKSEYAQQRLWDKIERQIDDAGLVIADITEYEISGVRRPNENVHHEIGVARAKRKHLVIIQDQRQGKHALPTDLGGLEVIEYWGPMDLGLNLYFGLKQGFHEPT